MFDQAPFIEESIEHLTTEGLLGLVFAVLVILVFLLSVRSTLVTAVSIPLSVLVALIGLLPRRLLAEHAHPRRAHHRDRPGGRRLDRRPGEHQAAPRLRRGEAARDPRRRARGRRRDHRLDAHHGRGVPADRARRRPGRRAVRAVRDHRHRRAARLAAGVADDRAGARRTGSCSQPANASTPTTTRREAEEKEHRGWLQRAYLPAASRTQRHR